MAVGPKHFKCFAYTSFAISPKLVGPLGVEPSLGGHLPQSDYKSLSHADARAD